MQIHLVDATYELFRAHFAPRPPVLGRDDIPLSGVSGLCDQLLYLLREEGATHVGCATDRVIESFRNDLFPAYKSSIGMDPELLAQFPIAESAIEALGLVLWPEVEFEADDAIGAAAARFAADPAVDRIVICTPDKDMAQCVVDDRIVLRDRRRGITYDEAGVLEKWGVRPPSIPDWLALVGASSDGYPGGARSRLPPSSAATARSTTSPSRPVRGTCRASAVPSAWRRSSPSSERTPSSTGPSPAFDLIHRSPRRLRPSWNGRARRGRPGRRSATNGDCRASATGRTAGQTPEGDRLRFPPGGHKRHVGPRSPARAAQLGPVRSIRARGTRKRCNSDLPKPRTCRICPWRGKPRPADTRNVSRRGPGSGAARGTRAVLPRSRRCAAGGRGHTRARRRME
jgi:hypothetical protein